MAVANTKSTAITNADATPVTINSSYIAGASLREMVGTVETAAADDDGSVYRLCRVKSSHRLSDILLANDAITSGTDFDVGVYRTAKDGGAVVSKDVFADGLDLSSAAAFRSVLNHDQATDIAEVEMRLWERLGLSADPLIDYDVCVTGNTVGSAAGTLSMKILYVDANY